MSTVVNGHREDENTPHTRPHGHILPMLSFSASTPTEEENPLDSNPAIAIDVTLWEQPEDVVGASIVSDGEAQDGRNPEMVPLIDVDRAVVLIDGPVDMDDDDDDDEPDENAPLLAGGNRGVGGGGMIGSGGVGGGCSDDGDSGVGGLGIPLNMPRSPEEPGDQLENDAQATSVGELRDVASQLVSEVINQAQVQATKTNTKVENPRFPDPHSDERLMEVVRRFVSDIMAAAKAEAWDSMRQIQNNNNNVLSVKNQRLMEIVRCFVSGILAAAEAEAGITMRQIQNNNNNALSLKVESHTLLDPQSNERLREDVKHFVSEILATAKEEAEDTMRQNQNNDITYSPEEETNQLPAADPRSDEQLMMKMIRQFVSGIMHAAQDKAAAAADGVSLIHNNTILSSKVENQRLPEHDPDQDRMKSGFETDLTTATKAEEMENIQEIKNNNNITLPLKEEAAAAATAGGGGEGNAAGGGGPQNLASPSSTHAERIFRGGPWYSQMGRVFSAFLSRICPCRCPTKP